MCVLLLLHVLVGGFGLCALFRVVALVVKCGCWAFVVFVCVVVVCVFVAIGFAWLYCCVCFISCFCSARC